MEELYTNYIDRKNEIIANGYQFESIWEHTFDKEMTNNISFKTFIEALPYTNPLTPSEGFSGGRTELFCLYATAEKHKEIHFLDVNSLYPFCQYKIYPLGHTKIIFGKNILNTNIENYFG
jgi:hypothetical protein